ncbi:hypothetical protein M378DRAFT_357709 [Amanita muscaria Koide BX008]|uniref:Uncharacterized protein n=1 Tax=Amanita muscaria (strain Koide BX008) TaxID=946122 RepID=A0A0C2S5A4_AMAMK|nr:hypothetical protein M378DRAFT_357709 [Amanita muscaria Koide BX008]
MALGKKPLIILIVTPILMYLSKIPITTIHTTNCYASRYVKCCMLILINNYHVAGRSLELAEMSR